jgi:hypothetical protein
MTDQTEKWFRVAPPQTSAQAAKCGPSPARIPWSTAEKAYGVYRARYGSGQSLERIAERGGFYAEELDDLFPGWRAETSEIERLSASLLALRASVEAIVQEMKRDTEVPQEFGAGWRIVRRWADQLSTLIDPSR